jgi:hypothetical protein
MEPQTEIHLKDRQSKCRCENYPPDRVCAWACVQGTNTEDILIGAMLEQNYTWAYQIEEPELESAHEALWDTFNT